jgi:hypothetical protein
MSPETDARVPKESGSEGRFEETLLNEETKVIEEVANEESFLANVVWEIAECQRWLSWSDCLEDDASSSTHRARSVFPK